MPKDDKTRTAADTKKVGAKNATKKGSDKVGKAEARALEALRTAKDAVAAASAQAAKLTTVTRPGLDDLTQQLVVVKGEIKAARRRAEKSDALRAELEERRAAARKARARAEKKAAKADAAREEVAAAEAAAAEAATRAAEAADRAAAPSAAPSATQGSPAASPDHGLSLPLPASDETTVRREDGSVAREDLHAQTLVHLRGLARAAGLTGYSRLSKTDLVAELQQLSDR
jgi:hypothetical protein